MYKLCEKCGFMYEDNGKGCPNCNNNSSAQQEDNGLTDMGMPTPLSESNDDGESIVDVAKGIVTDKIFPIFKDKIVPFAKKHKKILLIGIGTIVAIILIVSIISAAIKNSPLKISADDFVSENVFTQNEIDSYVSEDSYYGDYYDDYDDYSYSNHSIGSGLLVRGYNEAAFVNDGELYNIFDWTSLIETVNEDLSKKQKVNGWTLSFYDIFSAEGSIQITLSDESAAKNGQLKNGDIIAVDYVFAPSYYDGSIKFESCEGTITFTVDGLEEVDVFVPFDYVTFTEIGANSDGVAKLSVSEDLNEAIPDVEGFNVTYYSEDTIALEQNGYIIGKIRFYFDNSNDEYHNEFSNGDEVVMYCSSIDNLTENYGLYISTNSKTYTFSSLGDYITKASTLTQEDIASFKTYAENAWNERYSDNDYYSNLKFTSAHIADPKDLTVYNSLHNGLCLVYSYTYTRWGSSDGETKYMYMSFEDLIVDKNGKITQTPEDYYDYFNMGYDSVEDVLERVYGDTYNVVKIS